MAPVCDDANVDDWFNLPLHSDLALSKDDDGSRQLVKELNGDLTKGALKSDEAFGNALFEFNVYQEEDTVASPPGESSTSESDEIEPLGMAL